MTSTEPTRSVALDDDERGPECGWLQEAGTERAGCIEPTGHSGVHTVTAMATGPGVNGHGMWARRDDPALRPFGAAVSDVT